MKSLVSALALVLSATAPGFSDIEKKDIDLKASDGVNLRATYSSPGRSGPAMLLLHQCNMDRHAWDGLAKDLADAGIHVLTMDFRTSGEVPRRRRGGVYLPPEPEGRGQVSRGRGRRKLRRHAVGRSCIAPSRDQDDNAAVWRRQRCSKNLHRSGRRSRDLRRGV